MAKKSKGATPPRKIEYIRVPKHWFSDVLEHSMTTVIRPPTARTRRKELKIEVKIPEEIFLDLVRPLTTDCVAGFQWTDDKKAALKPTKTAKTYTMYRYDVTKPEVVDKIFRLHEREPNEPKKKKKGEDGQVLPHRRGHGCSKLHLSAAAEERGERTNLLAQVVGKVTLSLKVPKFEKAMPILRILLKVATMSEMGHIIWPTTFDAPTAAALRKQMRYHIKTMIDDPQYPTLTTMAPALTAASESIRQYAPQPTQAEPQVLTYRN